MNLDEGVSARPVWREKNEDLSEDELEDDEVEGVIEISDSRNDESIESRI